MWSRPPEGYDRLSSELDLGAVQDLPDGRTLEDDKTVGIRAFPDLDAARAAARVPA
jgi:hypothetical protein